MQLLQTIAIVIEIVKLVESLMNQSGKGSDKLDAARAILESIYGDLSVNWSTYERLINGIVTIYNATGLFKK